jgi:DnaJ-class molecular chaperone
MMTKAIEKIIESSELLICPNCAGTGEIPSWCGHEVSEMCYMCEGAGVVKSLDKQKHRKTCMICGGRGGPGCCDNKGYIEWESYELADFS